MSTRGDRLAGAAFSLVLEPDLAPERVELASAADFGPFAQANGVLLRCTRRLRQAGILPPPDMAAAAEKEAVRAARIYRVMSETLDACRASGVRAMFPKAGQQYPDAGRDLDLLVLDPPSEVERCLRRDLGATALPRGLRHRLAGTSGYRLPDCPAVLDVHWGRLGPFGDQARLPELLYSRRQLVSVGATTFEVPQDEDRMVLHAVERAHGRAVVTVAHLAWPVAAAGRPGLSWDTIVRTAREHGALGGLQCLLSFVDEVRGGLLGVGGEGVGPRGLPREAWGPLRWERDGARFPLLRTNLRLHARRLAFELRAAHWRSAGRLAVASPALALGAVARLVRTPR